jgi:PAS domain S-box-containing protein
MSADEIALLRRENELLRSEVRVAREAANITASAVVEQFAETERVLARMQQISAELRAVLDAASEVAVVATDRRGVIRLFNPGAEKLLGYRASEIVGKATPALFHVEDELRQRARVLEQTIGHSLGPSEYFFACAERERAEVMEWTYVRKDGTQFPVDESITPLRGPAGELTGFLCVALDLTEHKRAEREIRAAMEATEAANRTKSAFLANMSHELRTPLNAVIGYSEMLLEEAVEEGLDSFVGDLEKIRGAGQHLLGVINDILDISKIEAGRVDLCLETFEVRTLLGEIARMVEPLAQKNRNELVVHCADDVGVMVSDPLRVRQILFNLLGNACKFTERGRVEVRVQVAAGVDADEIRFSVVDSGIGMTETQLGRLFQPFVQADASTTRKFGGTGLGLAISRQLTELMSGALTVTSEVGKGTCFELRLPRVGGRSEAREPSRGRPSIGPRDAVRRSPSTAPLADSTAELEAGPATILVIDDDPTVHELLGHHLAHGGYRVFFAGSGTEGIARARELRPDVITLDVMMPDKDGWRVLSELKAAPETADIPVVMLTIIDQRSAGFALGAADYLLKPIDRTRLLATLERLCGPRERPASILVVDDEELVRTLVAEHLDRAGYDVRQAEHGAAALAAVEAQAPDAILLDLMMPVMDGFAFLDALRAREAWRAIPVVVVTAMDLGEADREALQRQVEGVLAKAPVSPTRMVEQIVAQIGAAVRRPSRAG